MVRRKRQGSDRILRHGRRQGSQKRSGDGYHRDSVVHHDRDRTGAVTEGNPDTSGLVGYTEYLTVPVDKEGNITEPVYVPAWKPDDYKGFTSGYIITASSVLADGTLIHVKEEAQRTDIRPYIKDGVIDLYMSWFMM